MVDVLSISPLTETAEVRGEKVLVKGAGARSIINLFVRYPDLMKMWTKGEWDIMTLMELSDDILNALIAAGIPAIDEENAGNLAVDEKAELLGAVLRVTMPRGPVPFAEALVKLMGSMGGAVSKKVPVMRSRKRS